MCDCGTLWHTACIALQEHVAREHHLDGRCNRVGYATRVEEGGSFQLGKFDPSEDGGLDEAEAERRLTELTTELRGCRS